MSGMVQSCLFVLAAIGATATARADQVRALARQVQPVDAAFASAGREGGEDFASALPINDLPFTDTGNTCGRLDDYDEACPWPAQAPDVVYSLTAEMDMRVDIDLCSSLYDTKLYLYMGDSYPGAAYACAEDGCGDDGYKSQLWDLPITSGVTYYIVVDGHGHECGAYTLHVIAHATCTLEIPPAAMLEGEPPLVDDYVDDYNSGCSGYPDQSFQPIEGHGSDCANIYARSGWYHRDLLRFRDTDWFAVVASGGQITWTIEAEFPVNRFVLQADCEGLQILAAEHVSACAPSDLSLASSAGSLYWLWVGPQSLAGPVDEFAYTMQVCGISRIVVTTRATWGGVKALYR